MQNKPGLRVAMIGGYPLDMNLLRGGVQAAFTGLVSGLTHMDDLDLHVLSLRQPDWVGPDQIQRDGLSIHLLPPFPRFERLRGYRSYQAVLDDCLAKIRPQVIHAQEAAADAYVALQSGYPTIVTVHGIRNEDRKYYRSWGQRIRFYLDGAVTEQRVIRQARYLIAISQYVTHYFASRLRPDLRCFFIPNAVDERFFRLDSSPAQPVALFAGRVTPLKRVLDLVHAFEIVTRQMPEAQLRIAGECRTDPAYVGSLRAAIHQAGLEKNVHLLGELSQAKVLQEYAACRLLALPSSQENAPLVIAQAMAAGKPVVATRVGGVAEMVGEDGERGLLVPVGEVGELARAILKLLQDAELCERMGQSGHRFAREHYHPDQVARRTAEVYRQVAAREAATHG